MMNPDRIKQAYAYGASLAFQQMGYNKYAADQAAVTFLRKKLAELSEEGLLGMVQSGENMGMPVSGLAEAQLSSAERNWPKKRIKLPSAAPVAAKEENALARLLSSMYGKFQGLPAYQKALLAGGGLAAGAGGSYGLHQLLDRD